MKLAEQLVELAKVFADAAIDVTTDVAADITADVTSRIELKARVEIQQPKELKVFNSLRLSIVLLLAIRYWDSLKS